MSQGSPRPQKLRWQKSRMKTMLIVFFDSRGMIHIEFVPPGQMMNADFYKRVLDQLLEPNYKTLLSCNEFVNFRYDSLQAVITFSM